MILGPVSLVDCFIFIVFLVPQLLIQAGLFPTILTVVKTLPFLVIVLPVQFVLERYILSGQDRTPFCRSATVFQDIVIRCVRFAFANIDASIGRVFFSKWVALPFFRFRMLRHGYFQCPIHYQEIKRNGIKGLWAIFDPQVEPDIIIYYCHGGGFSMGSSYFYLEFLMAWATCLHDKGFKNPAIFALEYTLVPDAQWPTQFNEIRDGYKFLLDSFGEGTASKICVSGDSAGATLVLSMLLHPASLNQEPQFDTLSKPGLAILISPWTHLVSDLNQNTSSDYLDRDSLHLYARQYGGEATKTNPLISPGLSRDRWSRASPLGGYKITHGSEEVFTPGILQTAKHMRSDGAIVEVISQPAGIHAWPVVNLFLGETTDTRLAGLKLMTNFVLSSPMSPASNKS